MPTPRFLLPLAAGFALLSTHAARADAPAPAAPPPEPVQCDASTGSRIAPAATAEGKCPEPIANVRGYSQEQLRSMPSADTAEALRRLDPSLLSGR